jgi:ABC-type amino acid transport substrate-binding protein
MGKLLDKRGFLRMLGNMVVAAPTAAVVAANTPQKATTEKPKEPAYERVIRTNTLRCGYGIWEPGLSKDPNSGKLSGIFYDYLEAIGKHTGLKIIWTEEIPWGDFPAALNSGRIDAMCFGAWPKATTAREVLFTEPTYFLPIQAYVREGDHRFDGDIDKANGPDIVISTMDSELSSELARTKFVNAKTLSIPQLSDNSNLLLNVAMRKADMTFTDAWTGAAFMAKNPGKLRVVPLDRPLRLYGHTIPVGKGEHSLLKLLNTATDELMTSGEFEIIVKKYATIPGVLLLQKNQYQ